MRVVTYFLISLLVVLLILVSLISVDDNYNFREENRTEPNQGKDEL